MADYYPLLAKAVAGLKEATPDARQAIYERARKALSAQLRNLDPPIPEEAIEREAQALEIAVAQLETEVAAHATPEIGLPTESDFYGLRPADDRPAAELQANGRNSPPPEPFAPNANSQADFPSEPAEDTPKPPKPWRLRFRQEAREELKIAVDNGAAAPGEIESMWPEADRNADLSAPEPLAFEASGLSGSATDTERYDGPPIIRLEARNSFASEAQRDDGHAKRLMVVFGIVGLVVILIAIAAYRLRDRPEDLVRMQASPVQGQAASGDKIADRVRAERVNPASAPSSAGVSDQETPGAGPVTPSLPVAYRAALLVQSKEDPTKVNTYLGRVIWRVENVSSGPDEPLRTAVHAEVEIPELKFRATVTIQKNFDPTLPASHTVKLVFVMPGDGPLGNIKQISALQMRQQDKPIGDTLDGITVPILENAFLIGLARGNAEAPNLERLRSREWLDVPLVLANGMIAKLTFEKGASGQRVFNDAIAAWQSK
jgi:hypothetical protein